MYKIIYNFVCQPEVSPKLSSSERTSQTVVGQRQMASTFFRLIAHLTNQHCSGYNQISVQLNNDQFNRVRVGATKCYLHAVPIADQGWTRFSRTKIWSSLVQPRLNDCISWCVESWNVWTQREWIHVIAIHVGGVVLVLPYGAIRHTIASAKETIQAETANMMVILFCR